MGLELTCPFCGRRSWGEFTFGGEVRPLDVPDHEDDFARVFLPANPRGPQRERWYHAMGCKTWFVLTRDTGTNEVD